MSNKSRYAVRLREEVRTQIAKEAVTTMADMILGSDTQGEFEVLLNHKRIDGVFYIEGDAVKLEGYDLSSMFSLMYDNNMRLTGDVTAREFTQFLKPLDEGAILMAYFVRHIFDRGEEKKAAASPIFLLYAYDVFMRERRATA